jgi:hypothetical protein
MIAEGKVKKLPRTTAALFGFHRPLSAATGWI